MSRIIICSIESNLVERNDFKFPQKTERVFHGSCDMWTAPTTTNGRRNLGGCMLARRPSCNPYRSIVLALTIFYRIGTSAISTLFDNSRKTFQKNSKIRRDSNPPKTILYTNIYQKTIMSLRCLAILGSKNEPLYICASGDGNDQGTSDGTSQQEADVFGFFGDNNYDDENDSNDLAKKEASGFIRKPASIRHEVRGIDMDTIKWNWYMLSDTAKNWLRLDQKFIKLVCASTLIWCFFFLLDPLFCTDDATFRHWSNRRIVGIAQKSHLEEIPTREPLDWAGLSHGGIRCTL